MTGQSTFIFAGGGTGGHLFPGIAVAEELQRQLPDPRIVFIGSERSTEQQIIARYQFEHHALPTKTSGSLWQRPCTFCVNNLKAYRIAGKLLQAEQPRAVIGLGGFASAPVVLAAARSGIRTLLLEQNAIPGRATRWLRRFANQVCLTFPESARYLANEKNLYLTGNPLRQTISSWHQHRFDEAHRVVAAPHFEIAQNKPQTLLILGGSQGAHAMNRAVLQLMPALKQDLACWEIVHQTGYLDYEWVQQRYQQMAIDVRVEPFLHDLDALYPQAELAITRAGATTLTELACVGCPAILMPYPHARDQHQHANARSFAGAGACWIVEQQGDEKQTADQLQQHLQILLCDQKQRETMRLNMLQLARPLAAREVCNLLCDKAA